MSHFASADCDPDFTRAADRALPRRHRAVLAHLTRHIANSAGALRYPAARLDAARCGIALYGVSPFGTDPADDGLEPALRWESELAQVKLLQAGESTGYGRRLVAERPTWIGIVPVGYADGFRRDLTGTRGAWSTASARRVVGTVSMDAFAVELDRELPVGTPVTLLGDGITAEAHARVAGTIGYELVTCDRRPACAGDAASSSTRDTPSGYDSEHDDDHVHRPRHALRSLRARGQDLGLGRGGRRVGRRRPRDEARRRPRRAPRRREPARGDRRRRLRVRRDARPQAPERVDLDDRRDDVRLVRGAHRAEAEQARRRRGDRQLRDRARRRSTFDPTPSCPSTRSSPRSRRPATRPRCRARRRRDETAAPSALRAVRCDSSSRPC